MYKLFGLALVFNMDHRLPLSTLFDGERKMLEITFQYRVVHFASQETFCVKDRVSCIGMECGFCAVSHSAVCVSKVFQHGGWYETYNRSESENETHEGVIRLPWSLAIISTRPPFCTLFQDEHRRKAETEEIKV